jgi:hypothetical protein
MSTWVKASYRNSVIQVLPIRAPSASIFVSCWSQSGKFMLYYTEWRKRNYLSLKIMLNTKGCIALNETHANYIEDT